MTSGAGGFRYTNRWPDLLSEGRRRGGALGGFEREVIDRLDQRDVELEDFLSGELGVALLGVGETDVDGEAVIDLDTPPGRVVVAYVLIPTQTAGTFTVNGLTSAPGTPGGGFACVVVPGGTGSLTVTCYNAAGVPIASRDVGVFGFGF